MAGSAWCLEVGEESACSQSSWELSGVFLGRIVAETTGLKTGHYMG
jgi:hypothetical protein